MPLVQMVSIAVIIYKMKIVKPYTNVIVEVSSDDFDKLVSSNLIHVVK
jgi:hypothetical protein